MGHSISSPPSILRNAAAGAVALITLVGLVTFGIRGGTSTANYLDKRTAIVACTGTGGLAKYSYCNWQELVTDSGSGSMITAIYYSVGDSPAAVGVDFTIGVSATTSGAIAIGPFTNIATSTGAVFTYSTGATLIGSGDYLRAVTLTDPTSSHTATMLIEYYTRLTHN
jgi:hypothetical protein